MMGDHPRAGLSVMLAIGFIASITGCVPREEENLVRFNIIQLSDIYEIEPVDQGRSGGLARVAAVRQKYHQENTNTYLTLSGDLLSPSPMARATYEGEEILGRQMVDITNVLGLDFATFGNHEFDLDRVALLARLRESHAGWVSTNVSEVDGTKPAVLCELAPRYRLIPIEDKLSRQCAVVALIGLTTETLGTPTYVHTRNPIAAANDIVKNKLAGRYDILIALTHQPIDQDQELAKQVPEIDLILGGHDGLRYCRGESGRKAPIFKSDFNARSFWVHQCAFDVVKRTLQIAPKLEPAENGEESRNTVVRGIDKWYDRFSRGLRERDHIRPTETVGYIPEDKALDGREQQVRNGATNLTRLIGQSMIEALKKKVSGESAVGSDLKGLNRLAIFNSGAVRLSDMLPPGPITAYDVLRMLPFPDEEIRGVWMSPCLVMKLRETRCDPKYRGKGWYLQIFEFDKDGKPLPDDKPLDPRGYLVAINNYLIDGKERGFRGVETDPDGKTWGFSLTASEGDKEHGWSRIANLHEVESPVKALIEFLGPNPKLDTPVGDEKTDLAHRLDGFRRDETIVIHPLPTEPTHPVSATTKLDAAIPKAETKQGDRLIPADQCPLPTESTHPVSATTELEADIQNEETKQGDRLILAESLIHLDPESRLAANEIVAMFRGRDRVMKREAGRILSEAMRSSPPALIRALLPLLDVDDEGQSGQPSRVDSKYILADVAELLSKVDPKVLAKERAYVTSRPARKSNASRSPGPAH